MTDFEETTPAEVAARLRRGDRDLVLLDCREPEEWLRARVKGALHVPMGAIPACVDRLPREAQYVVPCHHGERSARVCAFLRSRGFLRVRNLRGGIDAWSREVDPSVPRYGEAGPGEGEA